jgi:hypothetical protein
MKYAYFKVPKCPTWTWTRPDIIRLSVTEIKFLRFIDEKTKTDKTRNKQTKKGGGGGGVTVEGKLTNNRMKWYGYILRMNEERISKNVLNMKVKGKYARWK